MDYLHLVCYLVRLEEEKRGEAGKRKELQGTDGGKRKSEPIAINIQLLRYGTLQINYQQQKSPYYEQHRHNRETLQFQDVPLPRQDRRSRQASAFHTASQFFRQPVLQLPPKQREQQRLQKLHEWAGPCLQLQKPPKFLSRFL